MQIYLDLAFFWREKKLYTRILFPIPILFLESKQFVDQNFFIILQIKYNDKNNFIFMSFDTIEIKLCFQNFHSVNCDPEFFLCHKVETSVHLIVSLYILYYSRLAVFLILVINLLARCCVERFSREFVEIYLDILVKHFLGILLRAFRIFCWNIFIFPGSVLVQLPGSLRTSDNRN